MSWAHTFPTACGRAHGGSYRAAWSLSILVGPLVGGMFARYGDGGRFFAVDGSAGDRAAVVALAALPAHGERPASGCARAGLRVALICPMHCLDVAEAIAPAQRSARTL